MRFLEKNFHRIFLFFIDCYDGPRVKDQTPSQIQEMLEVIYDRMQYF